MIVSLVGRERGRFAFIASAYDFSAVVDSRPIYKNRKLVPSNYAEMAGKEVFLYYHASAGAWAISAMMGSNLPIAFAKSTVLKPSDIKSPWYIRAEVGYALDTQLELIIGWLLSFIFTVQ